MKRKQNKSEITTILFDLGNVLIIDTAEELEKFFGYSKLKAADKNRYNKIWLPTETGKGTLPIFLRTVIRSFGIQLTPSQLNSFFVDGVPIEPMWPIFNALKRRYHVAILTNNVDAWPEKQLTSAGKNIGKVKIFNSAHIGFRKPDPRIYRYVLKNLRVNPESTLFIDDKLRNTQAAEKLGIHTIHFTGDMQKFVTALKKYGIEVKIARQK